MCTVLDLLNPLIIPPSYHVPNTVRRVLMPTTWVRHYYLHVAEGKMESQKNNLSWPRCPSATTCQSQDSNATLRTSEGTLAVRFCNSGSCQRGGTEVSVLSAEQLCASLAELWTTEKCWTQSGAGPQSFSVTLALSWAPQLLFYAGHVV